MTFTIELSYPSPLLSPNARAHWRKVNDARQAQHDEAYIAARQETEWIGETYQVHATLTFHPPDSRRRDLDNMLASMKGALDGIAAALGVDDSVFTLTLKRGSPRKGGAVSVTVRTE